MNIVFTSCGNDSVALIQWCLNNKVKDLNIAYSNTKWGSDWWDERVRLVKHWVEKSGGVFHTIESEGFEALCKRKKAFPTNGMGFCSYELKIKPAQEWLETIDPEKDAVCYTGVRRCESARRASWPEWVEESENHGGRSLHSPLVRHDDAMRDELITQTPFPILPHRSMECFPCINANKADIRLLDITAIEKVERLEAEIDALKLNDGERFMFRSKKCRGAKGIRQVVDWANSAHGKYESDQQEMFSCESGFCGD